MLIGPRSSHRLFQIYQFRTKVNEATHSIRVRELMEGQIFNSICRATQTDLGVSELKGKKALKVRTCLVPYFSTLLKKIRQDSLKIALRMPSLDFFYRKLKDASPFYPFS